MSDATEARVNFDDVQKLCVTMMAAKRAFLEAAAVRNAPRDEPYNQVMADLDFNTAERAYLDANTAYQSALRRYQEQTR